MRLKQFLLLGVMACVNVIAQPNWPVTKASTTLQVGLPSEFGVPVQQPISVDGWEDGIFISRDGLNLYCIYVPADALSWTNNGAPCIFTPYQKGPTYGMDLATSPTTACPMWLHGDILISSRTSTTAAFTTWTLSNLSGPIFSEGAPQFVPLNSTTSDVFVFTRNDQPPYSADIYLVKNSGINPSVSSATILPSPVTYTTIEDNPHIERLSSSQLVLFFDSPDRPGGTGGLDLWYTISNDDGLTWNLPQQVSTLNTTANEHQPHLYKNNLNQWWIYFTTPDASGKYAIYRAQQTITNNWDSWGPKQLVLGAGNSAGIGEPTLTQNGDLSFVVVYQDPNGTATDMFDADPWFLPKSTITTLKEESRVNAAIFPNPFNDIIQINNIEEGTTVLLKDLTGRILQKETIELGKNLQLNTKDLAGGVYFVDLISKHGYATFKIIKS